MNLTNTETAPAVESPIQRKPVAAPLSTYRLVLPETGRFLVSGFCAPSPSMGVTGNKSDEERAAEFSCEATAHRVSLRLWERMKARTDLLALPAPPRMLAVECCWDSGSFEAWDAMTRMDRTSIEVGRLEAANIAAWMKAVKP